MQNPYWKLKLCCLQNVRLNLSIEQCVFTGFCKQQNPACPAVVVEVSITRWGRCVGWYESWTSAYVYNESLKNIHWWQGTFHAVLPFSRCIRTRIRTSYWNCCHRQSGGWSCPHHRKFLFRRTVHVPCHLRSHCLNHLRRHSCRISLVCQDQRVQRWLQRPVWTFSGLEVGDGGVIFFEIKVLSLPFLKGLEWGKRQSMMPHVQLWMY